MRWVPLSWCKVELLGVALLAGLAVTRASLVLEELHGLPSFIVPFSILLVIVGLVRRPRVPFGPELMVPMLLFVSYGLVLLAGTLYAKHPEIVWRAVQSYWKEIAAVAALIILVRSVNMLRAAVWGVVIAGLLLATINVWQELTGSYHDTFFGFARPQFGTVAGTRRYRIGGPVGDPNFFAQTMVVVVAVAWGRARDEARRSLRVVAACAVGLGVATIAFTSSRGGWIALATVLVLLLWRSRPRRSTVLALVGGLGIVILLAPGHYGTVVRSIPQRFLDTESVEDGSLAGRFADVRAGTAMVLDHPIGGVGSRHFAVHFERYLRELGVEAPRREQAAHGLLLSVATESGVVGLAAFGAIVVAAWMALTRARRRLLVGACTGTCALVEDLRFAFVGLFVSALFLPWSTPQVLWLVIALSLATGQLPPPVPRGERSWSRAPALS